VIGVLFSWIGFEAVKHESTGTILAKKDVGLCNRIGSSLLSEACASKKHLNRSRAMKTKKTLSRKLNHESLESRSMMAGNVNVYLNSGDLMIVGDNASNFVGVRGNSNGTVTVYGEYTGGSPTSINGRVGGSATFRITDDVAVYLYGGHDQIDFGNGNGVTVKVADEVYMDMGSGNDWVKARQIQTGRDVIINTGTGQDDTYVGGSTIGDDFSVYDPTSVNRSDFDVVSVNASTVKDELHVNTRGGNDRVGITVSNADDLYVNLGAGNDQFSYSLSNVRAAFSIDGGLGYDTFFAPKNNGKTFFGRNFERVTNS
jgi:hypothetical protein